jgi:acyl-coenzyme A thioesterase PaaI-like protein
MISTALDAIPTPPCSQLLGWRVLDARPEDSWIRIGFEGKPEFRNPAGFIQGGILSAMLDDTMGPAVFVKTNGRLYTSTISMNISFLAPAKVGPIIGGAIQSDAITLRLFVIGVAGSDLRRASCFCRTWPNRPSSRRFYD